MESFYRSGGRCTNCGRYRVQTDGVCDKCWWDNDRGNYASITRPESYDTNGPIADLSEDNDPFDHSSV